MTTKRLALAALLIVAALSASCGNDDSGSSQPPPATAAGDTDGESGGESTAGSDADDPNAGATGGPSTWYSDLDPISLPAANSAVLTVDGQSVDLQVTYCEFTVGGEYVTELPEQTDGDSFTAKYQLRGTLAGGEPVQIFASRTIDPEHTGTDPYEIDTVQFNVDGGGDVSVFSRATMTRAVAGGPATGDSGSLPMLKVNGSSVTTVASAAVLMTASGEYDGAVTGPFELAVTCP